MNPRCPVCGEFLQLAPVGEVVWDYVPSPPAKMRRFLELAGPLARIWECFGSGCFWAPARPLVSASER